MTPPQSREAGYTLTELLVVLVILGLIAAAITPQVMGRLDRSKIRAADLQLETLGASLDLYKIDVGAYPNEEDGLNALIVQPAELEIWDGPYVRSPRNLIDPWGTPIGYTPTSDAVGYRLTSYGADKVEGGTEDAADRTFPDLTQLANE